ncbi:MAG: Isocitrate--homoisocitrate dehydrogenase [Methanoregulaceae archaeon PtaU1.Bin059]|nr:MAG: Isocitrate--homoisocitrate dehydrogenase [Methanoregulaceae archaeon PtaB.Bin152]OPY42266.1 MAG: Isocitrate--homoisocitrate dehydrogenase [Methanoregulaceae archaeon PtaU1.Bin059]
MRVAVAEGDGIGHEVIPVAKRALEVLRPDIEFFPVEVGYGRWERTGQAITDDELREFASADAILFGAVTTPPSPDYRSVIVRIRKELDLYANLRPVWGNGFDIKIVRENTEGLYSGVEKIEHDSACTVRCITRRGSERIARFACGLAQKRAGITIGHKANVLKSDVFFREICIAEAAAAGVAWKECYIDALCLDILQHPERYDVIVTTNMFGDILSDVAAYLVGGLGLLPSGNIGDRHALFEPVHGSAPDIAGKNLANPIAALRSAAMLLEHRANDPEAADKIEKAINAVRARGVMTRDLGGNHGTVEFGNEVIRELESMIRN